MTAPDVVILGAGIMGASAAWHLARRGVRRIVLLDRGGAPGGGSTARATGGFRAQYATAINVRLSLLSRAKLASFEEDTGVASGYAPHGYLWIAGAERELAALAEARRVQHDAGLPEAVGVTPDEIRALNPALAGDGILGGAWCPTDGFLAPARHARRLSRARRSGSALGWSGGGRCSSSSPAKAGASSPSGPPPTASPAVPSSTRSAPGHAEVMRNTGFALPVTPLRRQVAATAPTDVLPAAMPMTIFVGDGFHLRVRDGRVLLLRPTAGVPGQPFDDSVEPEWMTTLLRTPTRACPS